ncbi:MAG: L,D-transpeptidase family protein [Chloroflexi bacterium]|nr:L,D-transpeptidase family protein [Chloroflexota bacterium]
MIRALTWLGLAVVMLAAGSGLLLTSPSAEAYPGGDEDEDCEEQVNRALEAMAAGQDVAEPDCLTAPGLSAIEMRAAHAAMQQHTFDDIRQLEIQDDILYQRAYRRIVGDVNFYDAPNGNVVARIEKGYNFVAIRQVIDGWVQLSNGQWVRAENVEDAQISELAGIEILEQPTIPYAWVVRPVRPSAYPGGPENPDAVRFAQYELKAIYGTEVVDGWEWYMVGPGQWLQQTRVAKLKPVERPPEIPPGAHWVAVDLFEQTAVAYEGDRMVFATLIASGLPQWSTNEGVFQVYVRAVATPMTGATGQPDFYFIENVPWVMYFDDDIALHGTYWHDAFGYRQSHGCVNLSIMDSWWLYRWSEGAVDQSPYVYVYSSGEYRADLPVWARRPR